ncbi:MAG: VWA domain-containing protein [Bacteroidetes bacterium]|nr:VWA domain-containing protein [Bacteroidota bacterium]
MQRFIQLALLSVLLSGTALADGLLVPSTTGYPTSLLRNRMTSVSVNISGIVAETVVYQEFVNEWSRTTDAVWAFPLPADARATAFYYWRHDTLFQAVLRVQEQVITPGTGEGGVPAVINNYIGKNGLKIELKGIEPWTVQRVELHYISECDYSFGEGSYRYPLASAGLVNRALDLFEFRVRLHAGAAITDYTLLPEGEVGEEHEAPESLSIVLQKSKAYVSSDVEFQWKAESNAMAVDFFSSKPDSADGYYALLVRPPDLPAAGDIIRKRAVFIIEQSSRMYGVAMEQTKTAVTQALASLAPGDEFNVLAFAYSTRMAFPGVVSATAENIAAAQNFVAALTASGGSQLGPALETAFTMLPADSLHNMIIGVAAGYSPVDPDVVTRQNLIGANIIMIGLGNDVDRSRLEMIAEQNRGFARFLPLNTAMGPEMARIFRSLAQPLMRDVGMEYPDVNVYGVRPDPVPPLFAGMHTLTAGRYRKPGVSPMSLFGEGAGGFRAYNFQLDFAGGRGATSIAEKLWAKLMIDGMEREIDVHGVRPSLKDSLIAVSLASGIRCRYTAYIADYINVVTGIETPETKPVPGESTRIVDNYPNPFNPTTSIRIYIHGDRIAGSGLQLLIYDMLGRLVRIIDLSHLPAGTHVIVFDGRDMNGAALPSGTYTLTLAGAGVYSTRNIVLMK